MDSNITIKRTEHPKQKANILSTYIFLYTLPQFCRGYQKDLEESDLYETLDEHNSDKLGSRLEECWKVEKENSHRKNKSPSLLKVIIKVFGPTYLLFILPHLCYDIIVKISQALFLAQLVDYYSISENKISKLEAYVYGTGIVVCSLLIVILSHPVYLGELNLGMKIRVGLCSLIYRKTIRLNKNSNQQTTAGQIINLLSNDVNRFDIVLLYVHYLWIAPIQSAIALYFMYQMVGISAVYGVVTMLLFIPVAMLLAKICGKLRLETAPRTDKRVGLISQIISGIQVIKMYTWEKPFQKYITAARETEISAVKTASYVKGVYSSFWMFSSRTAVFVTVVSYVLTDNPNINAKQMFFVIALFNVLRHSITIYLPLGLALIAETLVSIRRIKEFLMHSEQNPFVFKEFVNQLKDKENCAIAITNASAKWTEGPEKNLFHNLSLELKWNNLIAVIGTVGSGKSSLLNVILKELPLLEGSLNVNGKVSYSSQEPWLFSSDVRQNILFGEDMDLVRYEAVVKSCALEDDFNSFPHGDRSIVGERGISLSGGQRARINLARSVYKKADIYLLDDPLSAVDTHVGKHIFQNCIKQFLSTKTIILITHQLQYLKEVDKIIILEKGTLKAEGNYSELTNIGLDFAQLLKNVTEANQDVGKRKISRSDSIISGGDSIETQGPQKVEEVKSKGTISSVVYKTYINGFGSYFFIFFGILLFIGAQVVASLSDYFIAFWVNSQQKQTSSTSKQEISVKLSVYVYSTLIIAIIILCISRNVAVFKMCINASVALHRKMSNSIIHATMKFFNNNPSGRIINRFSKDMGIVDERLPATMLEMLQIFISSFAVVIIIVIFYPLIIIPTVIICTLFYIMRQFYLHTSRALKRLEGVTRSPVFSHLSASLEGLTTIRAFGTQAKLTKEFDKHQDLHTSAYFSFISSAAAFGYSLDLISVIYIALITFTFLTFGSESYGGNVGLVLTQALALTGLFQYGMKLSAEFENQMTSVERVVEYTTLVKPESPLNSALDKKPQETWPEKGEIMFVNLFLRYSEDDPPVLRNLNFTINTLEKIGIVGRTGAGKSSLISALFRLFEIDGKIIIDNVDIGVIGLHDLRSKISIIPQEPILFSGSLRNNLDPFNQYGDDMLWKALEEVELKNAVYQKAGGLNLEMSEGDKSFSLGQRQLVCLARAILQNNKILIMDEATANVDLQTDALIQSTIRKKFANCTVLTIAHRLNTVIDSDKILVMNAGNMVEFNHPHILLQDHDGCFYKMVQKTGNTMSNILIKAAEDSYIKRSNTE